MKLPSIQFYPGDWMRSPDVRACSLSARGLWMDMLCYMHESPERGVLLLGNGSAVSSQQLARMVGDTRNEVTRRLSELEAAGVFSRREDGAIYCRRMVRDEEIRQSHAEAGSRGGRPRRAGEYEEPIRNQTETKPESQPEPNRNQTQNQTETKLEPNQKPNRNQNITPSSSSSSSSSVSSSTSEDRQTDRQTVGRSENEEGNQGETKSESQPEPIAEVSGNQTENPVETKPETPWKPNPEPNRNQTETKPEPVLASFDPLKHQQDAAREFVKVWNEAGLRHLGHLTYALKGRLMTLLSDPWWAEHWAEAVRRCGQIPFLASGTGRANGPLDPMDFLKEDDFVRQVLAGRFDPRPKPEPGFATGTKPKSDPVGEMFETVMSRRKEREEAEHAMR